MTGYGEADRQRSEEIQRSLGRLEGETKHVVDRLTKIEARIGSVEKKSYVTSGIAATIVAFAVAMVNMLVGHR